MPEVFRHDRTRPYISSSPSNGVISQYPFVERFKAADNDAWGDVHYYNYRDNGTDTARFRNPRFASGIHFPPVRLRLPAHSHFFLPCFAHRVRIPKSSLIFYFAKSNGT